MTTRELFRNMRREFDLQRDGELAAAVADLVDQATAPHYGQVATRPGLRGRRPTTWRDLEKDALFLFARVVPKGQSAAFDAALEAIVREDLLEAIAAREEIAFKVCSPYGGALIPERLVINAIA